MKKIWRAVIVSLLITLIVEILFFIIGSSLKLFQVMCKMGGSCPNNFEVFIKLFFPITAIPLFIIVFLVSYLISKK